MATAPGPTYLQSFVGGVGLALPVHTLLVLNGNVFGISGFLHRAVRGQVEGAVSVLGLVLGGALVGLLEGAGRAPRMFDVAGPTVMISGLLVGLGTKMANGCTSGHMICGMSRLAPRSIVATATFMLTGFLTTRALHSMSLPSLGQPDFTLGPHGVAFVTGCGLSLLSAIGLSYLPGPRSTPQTTEPSPSITASKPPRLLTSLLTSTSFAFSLRLANMTSPLRVLGFLVLPPHPSFDPSLAVLAIGALPLTMLLYQTHLRSERKKGVGSSGVEAKAKVAAKSKIDWRLVTGAALFGVGWGMEGVCPGPALVNFGQALVTRSGIQPVAIWLLSFVVGGFLAPS